MAANHDQSSLALSDVCFDLQWLLSDFMLVSWQLDDLSRHNTTVWFFTTLFYAPV